MTFLREAKVLLADAGEADAEDGVVLSFKWNSGSPPKKMNFWFERAQKYGYFLVSWL